MPADHAIHIRHSHLGDADAVLRLAQLDSATPPAGPWLLGFLGDELAVARSLSDGRVVADPFRRTEHLVELVAVHARALEPRPTGARRFGARVIALRPHLRHAA